jgi:hypothetical protein
MQGVMHGKERSLLERAALAYGAAISLALILLLGSIQGGSSTAWFFAGSAIVASVIAVATRWRQIVWTALGVCLAVGIIAIFSIGLYILQIGISLYIWWLLSSRRNAHPAFVASDLFWLAAGLDVMILPLFVF